MQVLAQGTDGPRRAKRKATSESGIAKALDPNKEGVTSKPVIVCEHASLTELTQPPHPVREVLTNQARATNRTNRGQRDPRYTLNCKRRATVRRHDKVAWLRQCVRIDILVCGTAGSSK
jgi:hypothetical protein